MIISQITLFAFVYIHRFCRKIVKFRAVLNLQIIQKPKKFCSNILHHRQQLIPCCAILHCLSLLKELPSPHELAVPQSKPQESRQISTKLSLKKIYLIIRSSSYLVGFSYGSNRRFLSGSSLENYRVS